MTVQYKLQKQTCISETEDYSIYGFFISSFLTMKTTIVLLLVVWLFGFQIISFAEHCPSLSDMWWSNHNSYYQDTKSYSQINKSERRDYKSENERREYKEYKQKKEVKVANKKEKTVIITKQTPIIKKTIDSDYYYNKDTYYDHDKKIYYSTKEIKKYDNEKPRYVEQYNKELDKVVTYYYYKDGSYYYEQAPKDSIVVYVPKTSSKYSWN